MNAYLRLVDALTANGRRVIEKTSGKAQAQCPAHLPDNNPSLEIATRRDGKGVVVNCHAGCDYRDVMTAVGLHERDLYDDPKMRAAYSDRNTYTYPDGRKVHRRPDKTFPQTGNTKGTSLFGVDHITPGVNPVYVPEGEKDVLAAQGVGAVAVCSAMGAGKAHLADWTPLRAHDVIIVADKDEPGRKHARAVYNLVAPIAKVRAVESAVGKDLADHIAAGLGLDDLVPVNLNHSEPTGDQHRDRGSGRHEDRRDEDPGWTFIDGATFILDQPDTIPALWGDGTEVLWAENESLMIAGPMGLGKTTLAILLMHAQFGIGDGLVLDLPVTPRPGVTLYLAMDRPAQIARAARRLFTEDERAVLAERLLIWRGPPPADIAKTPGLLNALAEKAGAATVYLDSIKDAAIGLSDDEVGAGYNRARQLLLAGGRQLCEQHHTVKRGAGGGPPTAVADIYGSAWIANGTGSIIMLSGEPGDHIVGLRHVRAPADQLGPFQLLHDPDAGTLSIFHSTDLVELVAAAGFVGLTAKGAAAALFGVTEPNTGQVEKARRRLDKLVGKGHLKRADGSSGGEKGGIPTAWFPA